jgi:hypothetical protein
MKKETVCLETIKVYQSTAKILRERKEKTGIPMLKLVEKAVLKTYKPNINESKD